MTVHQITARDRMFKAAREAKEKGLSTVTIPIFACEQLVKEYDAIAGKPKLEREAQAFVNRDRLEIGR